MTRRSREESKSRLYHIMVCGNNREAVFYAEKEKLRFLNEMKKLAEKFPVAVYAYCIMNDHVHLLLRSEKKMLEKYMHSLNTRYSCEYNCRHERQGHVFSGRYESQCIEKEQEFWNCIKYIHNHPKETGVVKEILKYPYSSIREYLGMRSSSNLLYSAAKKKMKSQFKTRYNFQAFHEETDLNLFLDVKEEKERKQIQATQKLLDDFLKKNQLRQGEFCMSARSRSIFAEEVHMRLDLSYRRIREIVSEICEEILNKVDTKTAM